MAADRASALPEARQVDRAGGAAGEPGPGRRERSPEGRGYGDQAGTSGGISRASSHPGRVPRSDPRAHGGVGGLTRPVLTKPPARSP